MKRTGKGESRPATPPKKTRTDSSIKPSAAVDDTDITAGPSGAVGGSGVGGAGSGSASVVLSSGQKH